MKRRRTWWALQGLIVGAALVCVTAAFAETVYVQARTAQLRSGKTSLDPVVANLRYGDQLEVVKKEGNWLQVKTEAARRAGSMPARPARPSPAAATAGWRSSGAACAGARRRR
ncbi:MAG: hypothetical protein KatS3mg082_0615 [Nitrospiraceae bacterium]|nr:MAG: hypothetical protein KatS3mg082_0615 [Nitrospiraceae bacterium]